MNTGNNYSRFEAFAAQVRATIARDIDALWQQQAHESAEDDDAITPLPLRATPPSVTLPLPPYSC